MPDGELHLLPFAALMSNGKYFVELHTIVVDPSATAFDLLESRQNEKADDPLPYVGVAAWARPEGPKAFMLRAIGGPELNKVVPLPQSRKEVEMAGSYLPKPSTILLGSQATETQFKALPLSQFDVIHLALHGYVDLEFPDRSALLFAPQKDGVDDGLLQVREIRNLYLRSRLVTLSACNTGVGPAGAGGIGRFCFLIESRGWETEAQNKAARQERCRFSGLSVPCDRQTRHLPTPPWPGVCNCEPNSV